MTGVMFLKSGAWTLAHELNIRNPEHDVFFYSFEFPSDDTLHSWVFINVPDQPVEGGNFVLIYLKTLI